MKKSRIISLLLLLIMFFSITSMSFAATTYSFKANINAPTGFDKNKIIAELTDKDGKKVSEFKFGQEILLNQGEEYSLKISGIDGYILTGKSRVG